jgi:hypothetical protein
MSSAGNVTRDCIVGYRSAVSSHLLVHVHLFWFSFDCYMFCCSEYIFSNIVLLVVISAIALLLIRSHKSPVFWGPAAQMADSNFILRAPGFPSSAFPVLGLRLEGSQVRV